MMIRIQITSHICCFFLYVGSEECKQFMMSYCTHPSSMPYIVKRSNVLDDVLQLFQSDDIVKEYPLRIRFEGEMAVDTGGVCRDMVSAFWEEAYKCMFDGGSLLTPVVHPQTNMSVLPLLGKILSHGYLACGFLPLRIAFPALAGMLLGPTITTPPSILVSSFIDSLSTYEATLLKDGLAVKGERFSDRLQSKIIGVMSRFGARELPTPKNLKQQILQLARYEFQVKPLAAITAISGGIPTCQRPFWSSKSVADLYIAYLAMTATSEKVLSVIEEPDDMNANQQRVFSYLQQFIGNMRPAEIQKFLRFATGSSVCVAKRITVTFNNLSGLARRPISHTCDCILEIPTSYVTYLDFSSEFQTILSDSEYSWCMDAL